MKEIILSDDKLKEKNIQLVTFKDAYTSALCDVAQHIDIWQYHKNAFENPNVFKDIAIVKAKRDIANKTRCMFVIKYKDKIIGSTSYYDINFKHLTLSIGYTWLHPDYWGKGINAITKNLLISYAFDVLKFRRVAFCIDANNARSRKAVEKLGASFEGLLKKHQILPDGSSRDSMIYAITDNMWKT